MSRSFCSVIVLLLGASYAAAQGNPCAGNNLTFVEDPNSCDIYYACDIDGTPSERQCPNGMGFVQDIRHINEEDFCIHYSTMDCGTRIKAQPITRGYCTYEYGYFADPDQCDVYYLCKAGEATRYQCGPGLAYDEANGICNWMDKVSACKTQREAALLETGFVCPDATSVAHLGSFTRHAHTEDCRQFFVCFDGIPREYGCPIGTVFQIGATEGEGKCALPADVPGCTEYYGKDVDLAEIQLLSIG